MQQWGLLNVSPPRTSLLEHDVEPLFMDQKPPILKPSGIILFLKYGKILIAASVNHVEDSGPTELILRGSFLNGGKLSPCFLLCLGTVLGYFCNGNQRLL